MIKLSSYSPELFKIAQIRYWQLLLNDMLLYRKFKIPIHLAFGHEALSTALRNTLNTDDKICLTHRNASYNLSFCNSLEDILLYYNLEESKSNCSQMGSMNLALPNSSVSYTSCILANNLPVAAGIALNRKISNNSGIVFVLTGDGAIEEGSFWETLLFARSHHLKLIIIVENNNYSLGSTIAERRSAIQLPEICSGLDIDYLSSDGANYLSSKDTLNKARSISCLGRPVCVEFQISTLCRHAGSTPGWANDDMQISLNNGLIVEHSIRDPLYQIYTLLESKAFSELEERFFV